MLIHGNRPERLRDLVVEWIRQHPLAPLEKEVMLVQSNGIAQWLKLTFAADEADGGCGICAAFEMSLPARFLWQAYRAVLGAEAVPAVSPFDKSRLVWRLTRLLSELLDRPGYAPLQRFMAEDDDERKRFQLAEQVADLFDQYQVYRADWLAAWAAGEDVLIDARERRPPLPDEQRWQAALWRALLDDVGGGRADAAGGGPSKAGRAAVHEAFMRAAVAWPDEAAPPPGLPRRIVVFGISSLPRQSVEVLAALARWTQVLMCVHNPCAYYWGDIVADQDLLRADRSRQHRREGAPPVLDHTQLHLHAHPLLAAWGKQGRDFVGLLDEYDNDEARARYAPHFAGIGQRIDLFEDGETGTLLQQLQDDIRDLRPLAETRARWPGLEARRDASIRFHVAHSAQREVEILHDQLLAAFDADPTLRPRDVIVMVPDVEVYAPHIQAVFGLFDAKDARYIRFNLADRGQRDFDPLIGALETLLALPQSRLAASDVLDLLEVPALRARFGIDAEDVPKLRGWIEGANIRWGLHAEQRASLNLPGAGAGNAPNSWRFGLRRMLLGYASGEGAHAWHDIEPYAEIGGLDAALLGPLMRLVEALDETWRTLRTPATVEDWCTRLRALKDTFFAATDGDDAYTLERLDSTLQAWRDACEEAAFEGELPLSIVGDYWLSQFGAGGLSQGFFAGAVTFATLMPMRAIPFRRVCLLGMNDGDYPRTRTPPDFDLMRRDYRPGDRSRREDDRYLFLEALLSAREHLHVSWVGRSVNDNTPRPASVLVGQLRDHLKAGWRLAGADADAPPEALLDALTVEHPLQPFSVDYFPAPGQDSALFTYASEWAPPVHADAPGVAADTADTTDVADAARVAGAGPNLALPPLVREEPLSVGELAEFLRDPVRSFFRQRLRVAFDAADAASEDHEPFDVDALDAWRLQDALIRAQAEALARGDEDLMPAALDCLDRLRRSGELAGGGFGEVIGAQLLEPMPGLFERYRAALARWPAVLDEPCALHEAAAEGLPAIEDWIDGLRSAPDGARARVALDAGTLVKDNRYRSERLVAHWVGHLAAQLAAGPVTTVVVSKIGDVEFAPVAEDEAREVLLGLRRRWEAGMRRPLPLAVKTAFAWLRKRADVRDEGDEGDKGDEGREAPAASLQQARDVARLVYEGAPRQAGERDTNVFLRRAWPDFEALSASGEFDALARELLLPLHRAIPVASKSRGGAKPAADAGDAS
ncbi:exodeoxyribonuclease V subunit gamma [Burkholderia sp. WAC0059]|nr:exodeoxyribonuclease V subunit gamma [Burkholderia sp. WAC0059]